MQSVVLASEIRLHSFAYLLGKEQLRIKLAHRQLCIVFQGKLWKR